VRLAQEFWREVGDADVTRDAFVVESVECFERAFVVVLRGPVDVEQVYRVDAEKVAAPLRALDCVVVVVFCRSRRTSGSCSRAWLRRRPRHAERPTPRCPCRRASRCRISAPCRCVCTLFRVPFRPLRRKRCAPCSSTCPSRYWESRLT